MSKKIKKGDICVLTYNRNTIFEYDGVNKFGFPLTCRSCTPTASMDPDAVMYEFHVSKSHVVAYTPDFELANENEIDIFKTFEAMYKGWN